MAVVGMALAGGGRFVVLADDDGALACVNRSSRAVLWKSRAHVSAGCAVSTVGAGPDEEVISVDRRGSVVRTDPVSGRQLDSWRVPGCDPARLHGHAMDVAGDREHVAVSCVQPLDAGLVGAVDGLAAHGIVVGVHDGGAPVLLLDRCGSEVGRAHLTRPFAAGRRSRVAHLRAPGHWVGVRDLVTGSELTAGVHDYERGGYAVALSADERWAAWSGYEKYGVGIEEREFVRVVGLAPPEATGRTVLRGPAEYTHLAFSTAGDRLLVGDSDGAVVVVTLDAEPPSARVLGAVDGGVAGIGFTADGEVVAVGTAGEICSWPVPDIPG